MNAAVLAAGGGYGPTRWDDWAGALECLLDHPARAAQMSAQGRRAVVESYSLEALAPRLAAILIGVSS